jgi:predicted Zn-dependent protease
MDYNALLYQLNRSADFLKSFERAPESRELLLGKPFCWPGKKRHEEALAIYAGLNAREPNDRLAAIGAAQTLTALGRHAESLTQFEAVLARHGHEPKLLSLAAEPALLIGDTEKAAWLCEQGLARDSHNASCLAVLSIASRMTEMDATPRSTAMTAWCAFRS